MFEIVCFFRVPDHPRRYTEQLEVAASMYSYVDFVPIDHVNDFFHRGLELKAADPQPVLLGV